jgi:hypothetical protein
MRYSLVLGITAVFDFDLQMRFWRSLTDAMMHHTDAMLAASADWQNEVLAVAAKNPPSATNSLSPVELGATPAPKPKSASDDPVWWLGPSWLQNMGLQNMGLQNPWQQAWQQLAAQLMGQPSAPSASLLNPFDLNLLGNSPFAPNGTLGNPFAAMNPFLGNMPWMDMFWEQSMGARQTPPNANGMLSFMAPSPLANPFAALFPWAVTPWSYMQMPLTTMFMQAGVPYAVASPSAKASTAAMDAAHAAQQQMEKVYSAYRSDGGHAAAQIITLPWTLAASFLAPDSKPDAKSAETTAS